MADIKHIKVNNQTYDLKDESKISNVTYDTTNKKIVKTLGGSSVDVVSLTTLKSDMNLAKADVGLGNVDNKSSETIRGEITSSNITEALGYTPAETDTKNTAGATDSDAKLFLIGATAQTANPQTYSQDTAYVGTDGHLYSNGEQVLNAGGVTWGQLAGES